MNSSVGSSLSSPKLDACASFVPHVICLKCLISHFDTKAVVSRPRVEFPALRAHVEEPLNDVIRFNLIDDLVFMTN